MARSGLLPNPLSFAGQRQSLIDCMEMADGTYGQLQFPDAKREMSATCEAFAEQMMRSHPHFGFGALVLARMAAIDADWPRFNAMLRLSQTGASTEQWVSVERLKLYTVEQSHLEPQTLVSRKADIDLLLASPVGIKSIARLYIGNEDLRTLIADQAETLPEDVQARFLATLRSILNN